MPFPNHDDVYSKAYYAAPAGILIVDQNSIIIEANPAAEEIFRYDSGELVGNPLARLLPEGIRGKHSLFVKRFLENPSNRPMGNKLVFEGTRKDGSVFSLEVGLASALVNGLTVAIANIADVSERVKLEKELESHRNDLERLVAEKTRSYLIAKEEAERSAHAKSEFLSNMSHDIRTPLNAIVGLGYLLSQEALTPEQSRYIEQMTQAGGLLKQIVDDILDFSKLDAGKLDLSINKMSINDMIGTLSTFANEALRDKPVELIIRADFTMDQVFADQQRLTQILMNLLNNATKFTTEGNVILTISKRADDRACYLLRFEVSDSGIGISKADLEHIFAPFSQAISTLHRSNEGTGLGLSICRKLLALMGSELQVRSEPGKGSTFWFDLLLDKDSENKCLEADPQDLLVLIADDNPIALAAMCEAAKAVQWQSIPVSSGVEALNELQRRIDYKERLPDLLLLDWQMPDLDGVMTANQAVELLHEGPRPNIILVSSYERDAFKKLGQLDSIDAFFEKPLLPTNLLAAAGQTLALPRKRKAEPEKPQSARPLEGLCLLVVDDNDINRTVAQAVLHKQGADVAVAAGGIEALDLLNADPHKFDVVLLDLQMPDLDGYETCRRLRAGQATRNIPVVALTAGVLDEQRKAAFQAGVNDYIAKPFVVREAVEIILGLAAKNQQGSDISAPPPSVQSGTYPGLDIGQGLKIAGSESFYKELLEKFVVKYADVADKMAAANADEASRIAHDLKGISLTLGMTDLANLSKAFENRIQNMQPFDDLSETLRQEIRRISTSVALYSKKMHSN